MIDLESLSTVGWAGVAAAVLSLAGAVLMRKWRRDDKLEKELEDVTKKYQTALDDRDLELAAVYFQRLRKLRRRLGKT